VSRRDLARTLTDPTHNAPYLDAGTQAPVPGFGSVAQCDTPGLKPNPDFLEGLILYDLTRGGRPYQFAGRAKINQLAVFGQDSITLGGLTLSLGFRVDDYRGLTDGAGIQPRGAFSYLIRPTKTVIRGGFSHTVETPVNENLVVSSSTGSGGLASEGFSSIGVPADRRNPKSAWIARFSGPNGPGA